MKKTTILQASITTLSVLELQKLEQTLSIELLKVRNGIINDSFADYDPTELEQELSNKILSVQNLITAKRIRG